MERPVGVTVIGWVAIIAGAVAMLGGVALLISGVALLAFSAGSGGGLAGAGGVIALLLALWLLALGSADIILGTGILRLRPWAWTLGVVLASIGLVSNLLQALAGEWFGATLGLVANGVILYYLFTDDVKAVFGRRGVGPTVPPITNYGPPRTQPPVPPASTQPPVPPPDQPGY